MNVKIYKTPQKEGFCKWSGQQIKIYYRDKTKTKYPQMIYDETILKI